MRAGSGRPASKRSRPKRTRTAARTVRSGLVTKADLDGLETRFNARLAALETRLAVRFFGGMVAVGGVIVAAIELL